ncbi:MAG: copper chaperone PCu(A)C [Anaerolineae bacterium]|nr:copper chaperone PCu(A)C [Anaerolineae bacterium]NUQ05454.1 copper chaperone PCu(A)C [Anaerolineae bacterium]
MIKRLAFSLLAAVFLVTGGAAAQEGRGGGVGPQQTGGELLIFAAWVRPTAAPPSEGAEAAPESRSGTDQDAGRTSAAYMLIQNTTAIGYTLVSIATSFSAESQFHETVMNGDLMQMRQLETGMAIPAGAFAELTPGGYHAMLLGVTQDITADSAVALRLTFRGDDGSTLEKMVAALVTDSPPELGLIAAVDAYALPAPQEVTPGLAVAATPEAADAALALYLTLINLRAPTVNLIGARLDFAGAVEVRESYMQEGVITSRAIPFAPVPVQARLLLQPNGYFLRAADLTIGGLPPAGSAFLATLLFDEGTELLVPFLVR